MKRFLLLIAFAGMVISAGAVPALRDRIIYRQPDGTEVALRLIGDEFSHYYLTDDDQVVLPDGNGFYFAAVDPAGNVAPSKVLATNPDSRSTKQTSFLNALDMQSVQKGLQLERQAGIKARRVESTQAANHNSNGSNGLGLFPDASFPSTGSPHVLVILVEYQDVPFTLEDPKSYFTNLLNEHNFSEYGATGSALDYFTDASNGQFTPQFDVYGPVKLPQNRAYYGANYASAGGSDVRPHYMAIDACTLLDPEVDFSQYDTDNDGVIDNAFIFFAGKGEASGGPADSIWPHAWYVKSGGRMTKYFDGKLLDRYACTNEWIQYGSQNNPDGIGTFCHEFSHVIGLPDLYAVDYNDAYYLTPSSWSVLDYGPYNNNGRTPPTYSIFERNAMGWADIKMLHAGAGDSVTLEHILTSNEGCMIPTDNEGEFFLIENRQRKGWDKYIPGHGMLVWHIDYTPTVWSSNKVNNTASHQYVDIEEANGEANSANKSVLASYAFPYNGKTSITDKTTPSLKMWNGNGVNTPITDISEINGVITFNVCGGLDPDGKRVHPPHCNFEDSVVTSYNNVSVNFTPDNSADLIRYRITQNGTVTAAGVYTGQFSIMNDAILCYWAERDDEASDSTTVEFHFYTANPNLSPEGGYYEHLPRVIMGCPTADAKIHYTTDGSTPTESSEIYTGPFYLYGDEATIKAIAFHGNWQSSDVVEVSYTTVKPQGPEESLADINSLEDGTSFTVSTDFIVTYVSGKYAYVYEPETDTYGMLVKEGHNLQSSDEILSGWEGTVEVVNSQHILIPDDTELPTNHGRAAFPPMYELSIANIGDLTPELAARQVEIKNIVLSQAFPSTDSPVEAWLTSSSVDGPEQISRVEAGAPIVVLRNVYGLPAIDIPAGGERRYDIIQGIAHINDDKMEIYPTAFSDIATGVETITTTNYDSAPYYNLQGIQVANPTSGIYIHSGRLVIM